MTRKFHDRFKIKIDSEEARRRFVNRVFNVVFRNLDEEAIIGWIATALGIRYTNGEDIDDIIGEDFLDTLRALEAVYDYLDERKKILIEGSILSIISESESDLGIRWEKGNFMPSGAKLLDEKLINDSLRWLSDKKYNSVLGPFSKGLEHFMHSGKQPELLSDVITDMYEALEALAKIITERDKDLSGNAELFIKKLGVSDNYKKLIKEYISFANEFRHASKKGVEKPKLSIPEVESFHAILIKYLLLIVFANF